MFPRGQGRKIKYWANCRDNMQERKLIYLVDDDAEDREFIRAAFNEVNENCELMCFDEGSALISYLEREDFTKPDLLITDLKLPKIDGLELIQLLRERKDFRDIPIIVHTVSNFDTEKSKAFMAGANYYMTKAYNYEELIDTVTRINNLPVSSRIVAFTKHAQSA
jgi:CheY-like chemotaxis protein